MGRCRFAGAGRAVLRCAGVLGVGVGDGAVAVGLGVAVGVGVAAGDVGAGDAVAVRCRAGPPAAVFRVPPMPRDEHPASTIAAAARAIR
ncbi:hypothetical protein [Actinopolymorpha cephalotaxi]|uniref:Uncharacterized protein n=1 Tax=Actinopolymorpha cephalotaxi TaxID=504797 RepID=A0ABX2S3Y3_9ACTN|nr:hypothetical protein [Actinopolymorpha cephalotaxi]NYH83130.1 hypothetical protein [Actinopolymorpha cephalotaxi]